MHELSIAMGIVDAAMDEARQRGVQVSAVHLRLGALSGVVKDALMFSYEVACQDTPLAGSRLISKMLRSPCSALVVRTRESCNRSNHSCVLNVARRPWTYGEARNSKFSPWRCRNERAASCRSPAKCPEAE